MTDDEIREVCPSTLTSYVMIWGDEDESGRGMKKVIMLTYRQGLQLDHIKTHEWKIVRCSAITGENLHEGFDWVVQDAIKKLFLY